MRQCLIPALERSRRRERRFRAALLALTAAGIAGLLAGTPTGRFAAATAGFLARQATVQAMGLGPSRAAIDAQWRRRRSRGVEQTARLYRDFFENEVSPEWRRILVAAGMAPGDVLLRWANYDWTVVLSSRVFDADETGRAYRLRPNIRAFWTLNHSLPRGLCSFFFLPDSPEVREALADAKEGILTESYQTTNSWGCRGPEPDLSAAVRGLIIGDSFMQGIFVGDAETPPELLRRRLQATWHVSTSILNTGHIGYSPEQYYHTLVEYHGRVRPHFVLVSVCPNDFGGDATVLLGKGDWAEGKYWLNEIEQFCRTRETPCLFVTVPLEFQVAGRRNEGHFPGQVSNLLQASGRWYVNPLEAFTDEHLRLMRAAASRGKRPATSPLFNGHLGDCHFSAEGAALWAQVVGRRLTLLIEPPPVSESP